jgi:hypothetical protein
MECLTSFFFLKKSLKTMQFFVIQVFFLVTSCCILTTEETFRHTIEYIHLCVKMLFMYDGQHKSKWLLSFIHVCPLIRIC